jgi:hypothetical protein
VHDVSQLNSDHMTDWKIPGVLWVISNPLCFVVASCGCRWLL